MAGSTATFIAVPIVAMLALIFWIGMVFYANSHPVNRDDVSAPWQADRSAQADLDIPAQPELSGEPAAAPRRAVPMPRESATDVPAERSGR